MPGLRRCALFLLVSSVALSTAGLSARADSLGAARQNLQSAQQRAQQARGALGEAQRRLAGAQAQLAAVQARIAALDGRVGSETARLARLAEQLRADRASLFAYVRTVYKSSGGDGAIGYLVGAQDLGDAIQRVAEMDRVDAGERRLIASIGAEQAGARQALAAATRARQQAEVARQQAETAAVVVAVEEETLQQAAAVAQAGLAAARTRYSTAAAEAAAAVAAVAQRGGGGVVYSPVSGPAFTVDTNLTVPSGETAARLDNYLSGSALAGLGRSFMRAEQVYHVSARYFTAHAILESDWGTSPIAKDKHNLFGYGADDAHPYQDARSFPSFDACIQFVAQQVAQNYLSPNGRFYHGPTLRGMNVAYASDPNWASKIARIARTIPD